MRWLFRLLGLLALMLQLFTGRVQVDLFAFPTNLVVLVLLLYLVWMDFRLSRSKGKTSSLASVRNTLAAIISLVVAMLILGLFPQAEYQTSTPYDSFWHIIANRLGFYAFTGSWIFAFVLVYFLSVLAAVILRRILSIQGKINKKALKSKLFVESAFILNHVGLWLALVAGFLGSSDETRCKMIIDRQAPSNVAYKQPYGIHYLPFYLNLHDFDVQYHQSGAAIDYRADLSFFDTSETTESLKVQLRVNHPFRYKSYDIFLSSYDIEKGAETEYVVLLLIRQPWKYLLYSGILLMIFGASFLFVSAARNIKQVIE